ncbi:hypothetical protein GCM10027589_34700 [Actinocorallia lasiicapitis]
MRLPVLVCLLLALTACGSGGDKPVPPVESTPAETPVAQSTPTPPPCPNGVADQAEFVIGDNGVQVLIWGKGERGVLMAPQIRGTACGWDAQPLRLAKMGYRVAVFGWSPGHEETDVQSAAKVLYAAGAKKIMTIGASAGGGEVINEGGGISPAPVCTLGVSPVDIYHGEPGPAKLPGELLVLTGKDDPDAAVADVRELAQGHPGAETVEVFPGDDHGYGLIDYNAKARARMDAFVRKCLG